MHKPTSLVAIIFLSGTLALVGVACSSDKQTRNQNEKSTSVNTASAKAPSPSTAPEKAVAPPEKSASNQPSPYELALDKADGAYSISQSAQSSDDWRLVVSQLREAIALMQALPNNSPDKPNAKTKIAQYQQFLSYAQQQANHINHDSAGSAVPEIPALQDSVDIEVPPPSNELQRLVFQAAIKRRIGGTPVVDVTFNGDRTVEMIVDTGASGTVLTQKTANVLRLVPTATAKANTASAKAVEFPVGYVNSIQVGGAVVKDVPVAIAPSSVLETGLLGHDFFGNYDVTIKRDVVEFRPR